MNVTRRTQADRTAATRQALLEAARPLFGERGYTDVSTEEIVRRAGVTRGALYHQFQDKRALFRAVIDLVEQEVLTQIAERAGAVDDAPGQALRRAIAAWLDACERPDVQRILLLDAPVVLGWEAWQEIAQQYGLGATETLLQAAIDDGVIAPQPVRALAHILLGALDQAALYIARAPDRIAARVDMDTVIDHLISGLRAP